MKITPDTTLSALGAIVKRMKLDVHVNMSSLFPNTLKVHVIGPSKDDPMESVSGTGDGATLWEALTEAITDYERETQ